MHIVYKWFYRRTVSKWIPFRDSSSIKSFNGNFAIYVYEFIILKFEEQKFVFCQKVQYMR